MGRPGRPKGSRSRTTTARQHRVRCLGPGREHEFLSPDRVRCRVCPACTKKLREVTGGWQPPTAAVPDLEELR